MQKEILEEHPDSDVRVYVVWFNMLSGDSRSGWDECVMSDPRANHLWDEKRLASVGFSAHDPRVRQTVALAGGLPVSKVRVVIDYGE